MISPKAGHPLIGIGCAETRSQKERLRKSESVSLNKTWGRHKSEELLESEKTKNF